MEAFPGRCAGDGEAQALDSPIPGDGEAQAPDFPIPLTLLLSGSVYGVLRSKCHVDVHVCYVRAKPVVLAAVAFLGGPKQVT